MVKYKFEDSLSKNNANYASLSPLSFLRRTSEIYPGRKAVVYGDRSYTWREIYLRSCGLANALKKLGVKRGETVAVMASNTPEMYECHFGIPMAGGVINALNTRLDPNSIAFMLQHGEAKVLITDTYFSSVIKTALGKLTDPPFVIDIHDESFLGADLGEVGYEEFIDVMPRNVTWKLPEDEWDAIALSYTSGTTGNPKGVVTHHRGAYLNALSNIVTWEMRHFPVYLWTLPMFHCNGWCFPWTLAALSGTNICLREIKSSHIFDLINRYRVSHMCGAPVVYNLLINAPKSEQESLGHSMQGMVAGASPPTMLIEKAETIGIELTHVYGLTEVYGPAAVCAKRPEWINLSKNERAKKNGRQGVRYVLQEDMRVLKPSTNLAVKNDGETIGEICFRGNITMKGYLKDKQATQEAFEGGWFRTGDLATVDKDGYVKIKDRSKDIIISGGENISSIEIEDVLYSHESVLEAAVVAKPDEKWGEVPCAFITTKGEFLETLKEEIIMFCRERLAHYKCPKDIVFGPLPKTATGKIQKKILRKRVEGN